MQERGKKGKGDAGTAKSGTQLFCETAKNIAHQADQLQGARVTDPVIHAVGVLACAQHSFVAQNRQMLGNIALGGADAFDDTLHTDLPIPQHAQYLQAQRMRHGLHGAGRLFDVFFLIDQFNRIRFHLLAFFKHSQGTEVG